MDWALNFILKDKFNLEQSPSLYNDTSCIRMVSLQKYQVYFDKGVNLNQILKIESSFPSTVMFFLVKLTFTSWLHYLKVIQGATIFIPKSFNVRQT